MNATPEQRQPIGCVPGHPVAWLLGVLLLTAVGFAQASEPEPLKYDNPGAVVDLGIGLTANPLPMDYDGDGDTDLVVAAGGVPSSGLWLFRNPGGARMPIFDPPQRLGDAVTDLFVAPGGKPGAVRLVRPREQFRDFLRDGLRSPTTLPVPKANLPQSTRLRRHQWRLTDYDGDGDQDLVVGLDEWGQYGWEDAFNSRGEWTNGPLHGLVYVLKNVGTDDEPAFAPARQVRAGGHPIDVYGEPSPCFGDFRATGKPDLICGDFVGRFTYFRNRGTAGEPLYDAGRPLRSEHGPIRTDGVMIQAVPFDWGNDGKLDIVFGEESGYVGLIENTGRLRDGDPLFEKPTFFRQRADRVKFGVLVTPVAFDWDGDGDQDLVAGNAGGYVGFLRNLGGDPPKWAPPECLQAAGQVIRIQAGPNGSIQGPAEEGWGYTSVSVGDWDQDGLPDLVVNSIWGKVVWYRNVGTRSAPQLAAAQPVEVQWEGQTPKPGWTWWEPEGKSLATQWRTTPHVCDLTRDGLPDLVMLDRDGFLSLFERRRQDGRLELLPPRHVFKIRPNPDLANEAPTTAPAKRPRRAATRDPAGRLPFAASVRINNVHERTLKMLDRAGDPAFEGENPDPLAEIVAFRVSTGWGGGSGRFKITLVDWDRDGRLDVLMTSRNARFLRNIRETMSSSVREVVLEDKGDVARLVLAGHDTSPTACDVDRDDIPELIIGAEDGCFYYLKNSGTPSARGGAAPPPGP